MPNAQDPSFKVRLLRRLTANPDLFRLFDSLPDVCFFAKDRRGKFIMGNRAFLEKLGLDREEDLIGKDDFDFFPARLVEIFLRDDQRVIKTGEPLIDRVELVSNSEGSIDWHITTKVPLVSRNNHAVGIAGITRDFRRSGERWRPHQQFAAVIDHIDQHYSQAIQVEELASLMFLSVNQFERKFKQVFQVSPVKFLTGYRVHRACYDLLHTDHSITQVAIRNGFYDHSHFIRHFRNAMGMTPNQYRRC
ncbi:MAG TPA: AraC family transcriptional regulator [Sedimentisphaerales bacterium]|jgi:PAS domain S-box-containing protein|nr:AraC family transcriptional regulator [Sedimentisphaerales bacterium]HNU30449.1 AraC family transcriptional regulator [Sedimentisphaerales bacterium]